MTEINEHNIREYAEGSLIGNALQEFEQRLKNDPALRSELDLYVALKAMDNQRLKTQLLDEIAREPMAPTVPHNTLFRRFWPWLSAALVLILGLTAAWRWYHRAPKVEIAQIAQAYIAVPYPDPVATMGAGDSLLPVLQQAYMAYRTGDFASAARYLTAMDSGTALSDETLFYTGESLLQTGQLERSIGYFDRVKPGYWREIADWRCALALIQSGQTAKAKPLLEKLRNGTRRTQAENLLNAMD